MNTIKIIFHLATSKGWNLHQYDVKNSFLHNKPNHTIFMSLPLGYESKFKVEKVVKLKKIVVKNNSQDLRSSSFIKQYALFFKQNYCAYCIS